MFFFFFPSSTFICDTLISLFPNLKTKEKSGSEISPREMYLSHGADLGFLRFVGRSRKGKFPNGASRRGNILGVNKETEDKSEGAPCPEAALIHGKPSLQAE